MPVCSLLAVAAEAIAIEAAGNILVAQDARMNEVYLAVFPAAASTAPQQLGEITLQPAAEIQDLPCDAAGQWIAAGEGWHRYPALLRANEDKISQVSDIRLPRARYLLEAGYQALEAGQSVEPGDLVPAYVRHTVAKIPTAMERP